MSRVAVVAASVLLLVAGPFPAVYAAPVPGSTCQVFPADNIWNTDISSLPVHSRSAAWLASTGATSGKQLHPDFGGPPYGIPFNVAGNSHATTNFAFQYSGESDPGPYPYGSDLLIEQGSDAHLLTINKDTCKLYETFATNYAGPSTAGSGAIFDLNSNQLRPAGWTSADAAGLPIFPGLLRVDEVQAGAINHAIRFTVKQSDRSYLWPARHQAGSASDPNLPPMGARFRLKAGYDISTFGTEARVVLTAMKRFGLIVADNGSNWFFTGTMDPLWNTGPFPAMVSQLKTVPASAFEAIDESGLMVDPNSAQVGVPSPPTSVTATVGNGSAGVSWTAPGSSGGSPITSYVVTAYDGCTIQGSLTVSGATPATTLNFTGLTNGTAYTFKVAATNSFGTGAQSSASNVVVPAGAPAPSWVTACSTAQYSLSGSNGSTWHDLDASKLSVGFTPNAAGWAVLSGNADLWTANAGYNQDLGIMVSGGGVYPSVAAQPEAWKESGGSAGTFSPNAATVQTVIPVLSGLTYTARLQWKASLADAGTIFAGAGPISGAYSPTRLTVQLIPTSASTVFSKAFTGQPCFMGSNGSTWTDVDAANLSLSFKPPAGNWTALVSGNADLWTSTAGYNQDLGLTLSGGAYPSVSGQPEAWKESGGLAGTYSPNAAVVQASLPVSAGVTYMAKLQWKANKGGSGSIHAGAGPIGGRYSPTSLIVILVPASVVAASTAQYNLTNSNGASWQAMDMSALKLTLAPSANTSYQISGNADLWTAVAGYNQDLGIMVSGGAYGAGTLVAWKESGGFADMFSPNAAFVFTNLHLQPATTYTAWLVWKANRPTSGSSAIYAGAGPVNSKFSTTSLTAVALS